MAPSGKHWGAWILQRGEAVGFKRQEDFARAVGASRQQLLRWGNMPKPPRRMRKGFDRTLARALKTTRDVLFSEYTKLAPEATAQVILHPDHVYPTPHDPTELLFWPLTNALSEVVARLHQDEIAKVSEYAIQLVLAKNDARRVEFERLRDRAVLESPDPMKIFTPEVREKAVREALRQVKRDKRRKT